MIAQVINVLGYSVTPDSVELNNNNPNKFSLSQNYPNPFNPGTRIEYRLSQAGEVKLLIFNVKGQQVRSLVAGFEPAGFHSVQWNGQDDLGRPVASGLYFYRLQAGGFVKTQKMLLIY